MTLLFISLLTIVASCVGTIAGFGTSAIMIAVLVMFFPFSSVLLLVGAIHLVGSASKTFLFRKGIDLSFALGFAIPAMCGSFIGAFLVLSFPEHLLSRALGAFLVGYVVFSYFHPKFHMPKKPFLLGVGGALAGLCAGVLGIAGSVRSAFFRAYELPKRVFLASTGIAGIAIDSVRVGTYLSNGTMLSSKLLLGLFLFIPAAFLGTLLGKSIVLRFSECHFRRIIAIFLFIVGLRLVFFPV